MPAAKFSKGKINDKKDDELSAYSIENFKS